MANAQGLHQTPTCVGFNSKEKVLGEAAKTRTVRFPKSAVFDIVKLLGRKLDDSLVQQHMSKWPFLVRADAQGNVVYVIEHEDDTTEEISPTQCLTDILAMCRTTAEAAAACRVRFAVVAVPSDFGDVQHAELRRAAEAAGLVILQTLDSPTAAALGYRLGEDFASLVAPSSESAPASAGSAAAHATSGDGADAEEDDADEADGGAGAAAASKPLSERQHALVLDIGSRVSATVYRVSSGLLQVVASETDRSLSAEQVDALVMDHFAKAFSKKHKQDMSSSARSVRRLLLEAEQMKISLSHASDANLSIESLFEGLDFSDKLNRARLELLASKWIKAVSDVATRALANARLASDDLALVCLTGGAANIPKMQRQAMAGMDRSTRLCASSCADRVAIGAAIQGKLLARIDLSNETKVRQLVAADSEAFVSANRPALVPVAPCAIGVRLGTGSFERIIAAGAPLPALFSEVLAVAGASASVELAELGDGEPRLLGRLVVQGLTVGRSGQAKVRLAVRLNANASLVCRVLARGVEPQQFVIGDAANA